MLLKDCEVILIDTTGRSSKNTMQISELRAFIQKLIQVIFPWFNKCNY